MKVDAEVLLSALVAKLKAKLPTVAAAITAEKNDSLVLKVPSSSAWVQLSMDNAVVNYDTFCFIYLDSMNTQSQGPIVSRDLRFVWCLFTARTGTNSAGQDSESLLSLRYMRLMEDTAAEAWRSARPGQEFTVESLTPVDVQLENSTQWHRVFGVTFSTSLTY